MMINLRTFAVAIFFSLFATNAYATNGMLFDGYGPISQALGGAGMAFNTGNAAMVNNPATLGLMPEGGRLDVAAGFLMPKVTWDRSAQGGNKIKSAANFFAMPAIGYVHRTNDLAIGLGVYSQGGMGADYLSDTLWPESFSQISVGKVIIPVAYNITEQLSAGVTFEYTWAQMDMVLAPAFKFKDDSNFTGAAKGDGFTSRLGLLYKFNDRFHIGTAYQIKSNISDLNGQSATVKGFDMPAIYSIGVSGWITPELMLTVDYKRIFWSDTMNTIRVSQWNKAMGMTITNDLPQHWSDQNVLSVGLAYEITPDLTLRAGANFANNPVKENVTPLFAATVENHYTGGFGYRFNQNHSIDASYSYAPSVKVNNGLFYSGTTTEHKQHNMQLMYSFQF